MLEGRARAVRGPCEGRARAVRGPCEGRARAVREPCEGRARAYALTNPTLKHELDVPRFHVILLETVAISLSTPDINLTCGSYLQCDLVDPGQNPVLCIYKLSCSFNLIAIVTWRACWFLWYSHFTESDKCSHLFTKRSPTEIPGLVYSAYKYWILSRWSSYITMGTSVFPSSQYDVISPFPWKWKY